MNTKMQLLALAALTSSAFAAPPPRPKVDLAKFIETRDWPAPSYSGGSTDTRILISESTDEVVECSVTFR